MTCNCHFRDYGRGEKVMMVVLDPSRDKNTRKFPRTTSTFDEGASMITGMARLNLAATKFLSHSYPVSREDAPG